MWLRSGGKHRRRHRGRGAIRLVFLLLDDGNLGVCLFGRNGSSTSRRRNGDDGFLLGFGESNRGRAERPERLPIGQYDFIAATASGLPSLASVGPLVALQFILRVKVELWRKGRDLVQSAPGRIDGRQKAWRSSSSWILPPPSAL
jgi:hypothetical protein